MILGLVYTNRDRLTMIYVISEREFLLPLRMDSMKELP